MKIIIIVLFSIFAINCSSSSDDNTARNSVVYIDPSIPVSGNGTQTNPYKYWADVTFQPGTTYAQKKDTIAREEIIIDNSGTAENPIILASYGTGENPIIQGSELAAGWALVNGSIYSKTFDSSYTLGMAAQNGTILTYISWDTNYSTTFTGASPGSFSFDYDTNTVYIWCTSGTPNDHQMEISTRKRCIAGEGVSNVIIQDLKVQYASLIGIDIGACGILTPCAGGETCSNITIKNCIVSKCGGTWFGAPYNLHLGNGIQFANNAESCTVENCTVSDIFDSGITPQVYSDGQSQSAIVIKNSTITNCGFAAIEIAGLNNLGTTGSISNVTVENVTISGSGYGWSGDRTDEYIDTQAIGIKVAADDGSELSNIRIEQTSVSECKGHAIWMYGDTGTVSVNRTKIFNNDNNGIAAMDASTSVTLRLFVTSSLICNNGQNGIVFDVLNGQGYIIYNNTFYNNGNLGLIVNNNNGIARVKNNIFSFSTPGIGFAHAVCSNPGTDIVYDYNCYYQIGSVGLIGYDGSNYSDLVSFHSGTGHELNGIEDDPVFNDASADDFTLGSGTACRDKGDASVDITLDYAGNTFLNPPSIGAFQYY